MKKSDAINRIKQVLSNLISNAIKFTPSGHVCIKTQHQKREPDLLEVIFDVIDTGIGIDLDVLPTLFNPLYSSGQQHYP